jgi:hypothetical protein
MTVERVLLRINGLARTNCVSCRCPLRPFIADSSKRSTPNASFSPMSWEQLLSHLNGFESGRPARVLARTRAEKYYSTPGDARYESLCVQAGKLIYERRNRAPLSCTISRQLRQEIYARSDVLTACRGVGDTGQPGARRTLDTTKTRRRVI